MENYAEVLKAVAVIKDDENLRKSFLQVLEIGSYSQQVRVEMLMQEVAPQNPPETVMNVLRLLKNDQFAGLMLNALRRS